MITQFWDERYQQNDYAYGKQPNLFFKEQLDKLNPGNILLPAEGEGRNAVYAAMKGWHVYAFDQSMEGRKKAMQLATENNVQIDYIVNNLSELPYKQDQFDCLALIYAHFAADKKQDYIKELLTYLKKSGHVIFEAFSKKHVEYVSRNEKVGGPKDPGMLYSLKELQNYFSGFEIISMTEDEIELSEGLYHNGIGSVIRFVGTKR